MLNIIYQLKYADLSFEKLAVKSGVPKERLELIASESQLPTMSDVRKLSKALHLSIDFLLSNNNEYEEVKLLFRKSVKGQKDGPIVDRFSHIIGNSLSVLPKVKSSVDWASRLSHNGDDYVSAEMLAFEFRNHFFHRDFASPLISLPGLLSEQLNFIIYTVDLGPEVDGASAVVNDIPFIFISHRFPPRMLFTLAHELGHILAHHRVGENFAIFDKKISMGQANKMQEEFFSNTFASCLLLPAEGVGITLKKIREKFNINGQLGDIEIIYLSRIYGVSFEVAAKRCEDLDLLPKGGGVSLYNELNKEYGSPEKRAEKIGVKSREDIVFPKVSPYLISSAIKKISSGELSLGKASEILSIPIEEILHFHSSTRTSVH